MQRRTVRALSALHAAVHRITRGRVGGRLVANDMLLLTTVGRRSGRPRTVPLLYLADGDGMIVAASYGGRPHHPDWYVNLLAEPVAAVTVGPRRTEVVAVTLPPDERDVWWPRFVAAYDGFGRYQERTDRIIPLVRLTSRPG